jgi:hypothetical protein
VTLGGTEGQSRPKQHPVWMPDQGAMTDLRSDTYRTTYNRKKADEDWYSVELKGPATIRRVVLTQGPVQWDGGWFDSSSGKPKIEVKTSASSDWKTASTLESYPSTTATDAKGLSAGQTFEAKLDTPVEATAIRIVGKPAEGKNPKTAFTSCAELAAYSD